MKKTNFPVTHWCRETVFRAGLAMPIGANGPIVVAADRKGFSMQGAENWVWTFTPTLVRWQLKRLS